MILNLMVLKMILFILLTYTIVTGILFFLRENVIFSEQEVNIFANLKKAFKNESLSNFYKFCTISLKLVYCLQISYLKY